MNVNVSPSRSRWPLWTAIAAVAAVSLTTMVLVLTRDDADRIVTSSTTETPVPSSDVTSASSSTTVPPAVTAPTLVVAGPEGVSVRTGDDVQLWTDEPMSFAARMPDGSLLVQRKVGNGEGQEWTEEDTKPLLITAPGAEPVGLFSHVFETGWWRVHDIALVDEQTTVLIERQESQLQGVASPPGWLFVLKTDIGDLITVDDQFGGWEQGSNRLRLAENGVIVGVQFAEATWSLISYSLGAAPPVTAAQLGLEDSYYDCTCPSEYTIDRTGTHVAWEVGGELVVTELATGTIERFDLPPVNGPVMGIELGDGIVVIDRYTTWQPLAPLVVDLDTLTATEITGAISADIA